MKNKLIIVVDCQYDFINPEGALFVPGAPQAIENIKSLLRMASDEDLVIFTADSHPESHCSFVQNGGEWPVHCVTGSRGSELDLDLQKIVGYSLIVDKGFLPEREEYSAFVNESYRVIPPVSLQLGQVIVSEVDTLQIIVCGVAGDYCVLETMRTLSEHFKDLSVYLPGVASIDGGEKLGAWMIENNISEFNLNLEENECN